MLQLIDTAEQYKNETEIGKGLQELFKSGAIKREELFVTSKLWTDHHPGDQVRPGLKDTLSRRQLEYLDLYLIHWCTSTTIGNDYLCLHVLLTGPESIKIVQHAVRHRSRHRTACCCSCLPLSFTAIRPCTRLSTRLCLRCHASGRICGINCFVPHMEPPL